MRKRGKIVFLLLALTLIAVPLVAGCAPAAPATPTKAPEPAKPAAATPSAPQPTKPAATPAAAKPAAPSGEPYKIGFVNSLSGYMAPMGTPERDAVLLLEEKINAEGGINGRPLKVIVYDDQSNESQGVMAVKKLIEQDKVLGIVGTSASGIAMAEAPTVEEAKVPWVTMQSSRAILSPPKKWIFKLPLSEKFYIDGLYRYMKEQKLQKIGLLTQGAGFGKEAKKYFEDTAQANGFTIVANEAYGPNDTDITAPLTKIKAANPDVLIVYGAEAAGAIAVRQAKEIGIKVPILGPESLTMQAIMDVKELRDGLNGFIASGHKPDVWQQLPDTDKQKKVIADFDTLIRKKYNRGLSMWDGNGYDAFMVMVNALKKANPDPTNIEQARQQIRDAIETTKDFVGVANIISYAPDQHEIVDDKALEAGSFNQIVDGKFKLLKTFK